MHPPPLKQFTSFVAASFRKAAHQGAIRDVESLRKASLLATQGAQPPAVGMLRSHPRTMSAPMSPPSLTRRNEARSYSTDSHHTSFEGTLLPHHPLNEEDHQTLKAVLGPDIYEKLRHSRHQGGLCHADTTVKIIEAAKGKVSSITTDLINFSAKVGKQKGPLGFIGGLFVGNALNIGVPFYEGVKGNSYSYGKSQLLEQGVPKDAIAIVISATQGAIDPDSKQALSANAFFKINAGTGGGANHAFAVLHVDHENGQLLCCDLDPYRQNADGTDKDVYFKVDKETFEKRVIPRLFNGVMAIKKQKDDE